MWFIKTVQSVIKNWYIFSFIGLLFILVGARTLNTPYESFSVLAVLFSITFIVSGILEIIFSIQSRKIFDNWTWHFVLGLVNFFIGTLLLLQNEMSMLVLSLYVWITILLRSAWAIATGLELKKYYIKDWKVVVVLWVLWIIISFILLWNPAIAWLSIVFFTGMAFMLFGIFNIYLSVKLKNIHEISEKFGSKINELKWKIENSKILD